MTQLERLLKSWENLEGFRHLLPNNWLQERTARLEAGHGRNTHNPETHLPDSIKRRFLSHVQKTDNCWLWKSRRNAKGYGTTSVGSCHVLAHRLSYTLFRHAFKREMCVLHHCDNPQCVNPAHLFVGTQIENIQDCVKKGRKIARRTSAWPSAKLTINKVKAMRILAKQTGLGPYELNNVYQFGVSGSLVSRILKHKVWKWLD